MKKQLILTLDQTKSMLGKNEELDILIKSNFTEKELLLNVTDRIKTLKDALIYNKINIDLFDEEIEKCSMLFSKQAAAFIKLQQIAKALRENKDLNLNQNWYYPYFKKNNYGFSYYGSGYVITLSVVSASICVDTEEKAIYMGKQFIDIYNDYLMP